LTLTHIAAVDIDAFWSSLRGEAERASAREPILAGFFEYAILRHDGFAAALGAYLSSKIGNAELSELVLQDQARAVYGAVPAVVFAAIADLRASRERNPAYVDHITPFLYFKGYQALQLHRIGHELWKQGRHELATYLQSRVSEAFGVDIHPAARLGIRIFIDHATGIVIGETAVVGNDVSILQGVTLGGTGKETGDRHPKVGSGVLLSAGAKVLGNITIGEGARIGAGSVVLKAVPAHTTAVGIPARIVGMEVGEEAPALSMDQQFWDYEI